MGKYDCTGDSAHGGAVSTTRSRMIETKGMKVVDIYPQLREGTKTQPLIMAIAKVEL